MSYDRILVAIDKTDEAAAVLEAARRVSAGAALSIVTVLKPMTDFYVNLFSLLEDDTVSDFETRAKDQALEWLAATAEECGIEPAGKFVAIGNAGVEIRRLAEEVGADLIVLGKHGRQLAGRIMLGSTANNVLHHASCDVLAVHIDHG